MLCSSVLGCSAACTAGEECTDESGSVHENRIERFLPPASSPSPQRLPAARWHNTTPPGNLVSRPMKTHLPTAWLFAVRIGTTAFLLSCIALSCHTDGEMKKTGDGSPSPDAVQYGVQYIVGGIDRLILTKRDNARNVCVQVTLASPSGTDPGGPAGSVQLPPNWTVEGAFAVPDAGACVGMTRRRPAGAIDANEVAGSVRWGSSPTEGTTVDLRLSFPAQGGMPAFTEQLSFAH